MKLRVTELGVSAREAPTGCFDYAPSKQALNPKCLTGMLRHDGTGYLGLHQQGRGARAWPQMARVTQCQHQAHH